MQIAIVGMACRFPGANSVDEFWELLWHKRVAYQPPVGRVDLGVYGHEEPGTLGRTYAERVGLVDYAGLDRLTAPFDAALRSESDPAHLLLAALARDAVSGESLDRLAARPCGVFVGHSRGSELVVDQAVGRALPDWLDKFAGLEELRGLPADTRERLLADVAERLSPADHRRRVNTMRLEPHRAASVVSQALGLNGPSVVVNAACGSSLQALWLAAQALERGEVGAAIVGGSNHLRTAALVRLAQAQTLARNESRPLDANADGMVVAEGYGVLVAKRLADALADGDPIRAVVRAVAVGSDGRGKSFWAPRCEGQARTIREAYRDGLSTDSIGAIEAHATGTIQGDTSEVSALADVFGSGEPVWLAGAKGNFGHALEAAGMAGVMKSVLTLERSTLPPQAGYATPNAKLSDAARFRVPTGTTPWPRHAAGEPRRIGVNAFGIGGLNYHAVIEEAAAPTDGTINAAIAPEASDGAVAPLAVLGVGAVLPGCDHAKDLPLALGDPQRTTTLDGWQYDWRRHRIPPKQIALGNPLQYLVLDAVDQAWTAAGLGKPSDAAPGLDRERVGVVVGSGFDSDYCQSVQLGMRVAEVEAALAGASQALGATAEQAAAIAAEAQAAFADAWHVGLRDETGSSDASTLATRVTKEFDLGGGAMAIDAGDGSSYEALQAASDLIRTGRCDVVVCAAAEQRRELRPGDPIANGEGATAVVLASEAAAARLDAVPVARLRLIAEPVAESEANASALLDAACPVTRRFGDLGAAKGLARLVSVVATGATERFPQVAGPTRCGWRRSVAFEGVVPADGTTQTMSEAIPAAENPAAKIPAAVKRQAERPVYQIVRIGTPTREELLAALDSPSIDTAREAFSAADRWRAALVVGNPAQLPEKAAAARERLAGPAGEASLLAQGVFAGRLPERRPRVAFVFPGQASQYDQMLRSLVESHPLAQQAMQRVDAVADELGFPPLHELAWENERALSTDVWRTQMSLLMAAEVLRETVVAAGVTPDFISGHSFGEYPALVAAGAWTLDHAMRATHARCVATKLSWHAKGGMLAVAGSADAIQELLRDSDRPVYVSGYNAPDQTVCGGALDDLREVAAALELKGLASRLVEAPCPAHTPLMSDIREPIERSLRRVTIRPPRTPFLSSVSGRYEADPERIKQNLVDQLTQPVVYVEQVRRLVADGATHLVEVGPGQVLTLLNRRIARPPACVALPIDHRNRNGAEQLASVVAALEVAGATDPSLWPACWAGEPVAPPSVTLDPTPGPLPQPGTASPTSQTT